MTEQEESSPADELEKPDAKAKVAAPAPPRDSGPPREERRTRALISIGVGLTLTGIALSVNDDGFARWLVLGGVAIAFVALHRYGRLGPQAV